MDPFLIDFAMKQVAGMNERERCRELTANQSENKGREEDKNFKGNTEGESNHSLAESNSFAKSKKFHLIVFFKKSTSSNY